MSVCVHACVRACVHACARAIVCVCLHTSVFRDRELVLGFFTERDRHTERQRARQRQTDRQINKVRIVLGFFTETDRQTETEKETEGERERTYEPPAFLVYTENDNISYVQFHSLPSEK